MLHAEQAPPGPFFLLRQQPTRKMRDDARDIGTEEEARKSKFFVARHHG
jgi:hypothetical protein